MFESDLAEGNHLVLEESGSYRFHNKTIQRNRCTDPVLA
jgi:hypothetical protein